MTAPPLPSRSGRERLSIGWQLRVLRAYAGLTQAELGEMLGLESGAVSRIESGQRPLRRATWELLAERLRHPKLRQRLEGAGYPHPWPGEDGDDLVDNVLSRRPPRCRRCGLLLDPSSGPHPIYCDRCVQEMDAEISRAK